MVAFFKAKPDVEVVHLLADHLEAVLGLADEMKALAYAPHAGGRGAAAGQILDDLARLSTFVERLSTAELAVAAKVAHARKSAERLARTDSRLGPFARLFIGGTAALEEALPRLADRSEDDFNHREEPIAFLKTRGLLAHERNTLDGFDCVRPDRDYLVLGLVPLGVLTELVDASLRALDAQFDIYEKETGEAPEPAVVAVPEPRPQRLTDRLKQMVRG